MKNDANNADAFFRLSKALKQAGQVELRKELNKNLLAAAKPLIADVRAAARSELPKSGGLNERVAKGGIRAQVRTGAATAGVRIVGKGSGLRGTNRGKVRHPVFGNRNTWVEQNVDGGWFDDTLSAKASSVRPFLEQAIEQMAEKIVRDVQ